MQYPFCILIIISSVRKTMSMHVFSTLDVDLRQKAPKIVIFLFYQKNRFLVKENNSLKSISEK